MDNTPEIPASGTSESSGTSKSSGASESSESTESPDILDDVTYILYQASGGKRFTNYLVDGVVIYLLWRFLVGYWFVEILIAINFPIGNRPLLYLFAYLGAVFFHGLFIGGFEAATGGKTLGKYISGTRAVTDDGIPVGPKKAFLRFLSRMVPFEVFSALGTPCYPWHDRWTKTVVIDEKLTTLPPQA